MKPLAQQPPNPLLPGLKAALELIEGRIKILGDKMSVYEVTQELKRVAAMVKFEIEVCNKVGKPLKLSKSADDLGSRQRS